MHFTSCALASATVLVLLTCNVQGRPSSYLMEKAASQYIVDHILPKHPVLALKLLTVLFKSEVSPLLDFEDSDEEESQKSIKALDLMKALHPSTKRGLGQCINTCLNGRGNMNFIQCKSMCH